MIVKNPTNPKGELLMFVILVGTVLITDFSVIGLFDSQLLAEKYLKKHGWQESSFTLGVWRRKGEEISRAMIRPFCAP